MSAPAKLGYGKRATKQHGLQLSTSILGMFKRRGPGASAPSRSRTLTDEAQLKKEWGGMSIQVKEQWVLAAMPELDETRKGSFQKMPVCYDPGKWAGTVDMTNAQRHVLVQAHKAELKEHPPTAATR